MAEMPILSLTPLDSYPCKGFRGCNLILLETIVNYLGVNLTPLDLMVYNLLIPRLS